MKIVLLSVFTGAACAFTPAANSKASVATSCSMSETADVTAAPAQPAVEPINGWVSDASKPCYGLTGSSVPKEMVSNDSVKPKSCMNVVRSCYILRCVIFGF